jgi:hypothetical protein
MDKLNRIRDYGTGAVSPYLQFHCPGCGIDHCISTQVHTWNGSLDKPTFQPSILADRPGAGRCHSYVTDGKIAFCNDSTHRFAAQTLDLPNWETETQEREPMPQKKEFKSGDQVKLLAPHVSGIAAEVVNTGAPNGDLICKITSSEHPSGHSQEGTLVMFPADQLELVASGIPKEVELQQG